MTSRPTGRPNRAEREIAEKICCLLEAGLSGAVDDRAVSNEGLRLWQACERVAWRHMVLRDECFGAVEACVEMDCEATRVPSDAAYAMVASIRGLLAHKSGT